ncbi:hypothetical protein DB32_000623 [Sandaracinus amylolyticus]|uniref:Uncharacterized protein n=1 Tax=Sandaracinus amylolyticus TaxID=927083 RepID=A0A0F6SDH9_9BACT|nr:hypothetical protein DB32_000623 [Sandaracinus amylolyticus]
MRPAIHEVMEPPNEPPIAAMRDASTSSRATSASVTRTRSSKHLPPQSPHTPATNACPCPVDRRGFGSATAYPADAATSGCDRRSRDPSRPHGARDPRAA